MPLCHFWGIHTLQDVLLLLLILCNLQPTHSCSVSDAFGSARQLGSTSTKSLMSVKLRQSAFTIWPKAVTMSLMSIVTVLLLFLYISVTEQLLDTTDCFISDSYFIWWSAWVFWYSGTRFGSAKWPSLTQLALLQQPVWKYQLRSYSATEVFFGFIYCMLQVTWIWTNLHKLWTWLRCHMESVVFCKLKLTFSRELPHHHAPQPNFQTRPSHKILSLPS